MDGTSHNPRVCKIREMLEARERKQAPIGLIVIGLRTELGLTQQEMAYILNTKVETIQAMEQGFPLKYEKLISRIASLMSMLMHDEL